MITLSNNFLQVKIHPRGAELHSVFSPQHQLGYLWQADEKIWPRHAPHLFPFVGKLANNSFTHKGRSYPMTQHGFARDKEFKVTSQGAQQAELELRSDNATKEIYPFDFLLKIKYTLEGQSLVIEYTVQNLSSGQMYFSLGAHPGFSLELKEAKGMRDFLLIFGEEENTQRFFVKEGLIAETPAPFSTSEKVLPLNEELFTDDALVFKRLRSRSVELRNKQNLHGVKVEWSPAFSYFGIWSKPGCDRFICLEPWAGIADGEHFSGELEEKEGIRRLDAAEQENFRLVFSFF